MESGRSERARARGVCGGVCERCGHACGAEEGGTQEVRLRYVREGRETRGHCVESATRKEVCVGVGAMEIETRVLFGQHLIFILGSRWLLRARNGSRHGFPIGTKLGLVGRRWGSSMSSFFGKKETKEKESSLASKEQGSTKATESTPLAGKPKEEEAESNKKFVTVASCLAFMVCSAGMMLVNRQVVRLFHTPLIILDIQLLFAAIVLPTLFFWALRFGSWRDVWRWVSVVTPLYAGMLGTSMIAQLYAGVGLQVAIRNLGPLIALPIESVFNEPIVADKWTWLSLLVILAGVIMYVSEVIHQQDMSELVAGILLMILNLIVALFERLFQRRLIAIEPVDVSKTGMLLLNNAGAILPVSALLLVPGQLHETDIVALHWNAERTWDHYAALVISCITGVAIGWTAINAQQYVTATTMLVITNLNKVVVVIIGAVFMAEPHGALAMSGMALALSGGVFYALARNGVADRIKKEKEEQKAKNPA